MEIVPSPANLLGEIARAVEQFRLPGLDAGTLLEAGARASTPSLNA